MSRNSAPSAFGISSDMAVEAALVMMKRGAELDEVETALRIWFEKALGVGFTFVAFDDGDRRWFLNYQGWELEPGFQTLHEMLPTLLGMIGKTPDELVHLFCN